MGRLVVLLAVVFLLGWLAYAWTHGRAPHGWSCSQTGQGITCRR